MKRVRITFRMEDIKDLQTTMSFEVGEFENFIWSIVNKKVNGMAGELESDTCTTGGTNCYWIGINVDDDLIDKNLEEIKETLEESIYIVDIEQEIIAIED